MGRCLKSIRICGNIRGVGSLLGGRRLPMADDGEQREGVIAAGTTCPIPDS